MAGGLAMPGTSRASEAKERGNKLLQLGEVQAAQKAYQESLMLIQKLTKSQVSVGILRELEELQLSCFLNLAQCNLKNEDYAVAIKNASSALDIDAMNCKALYRRGLAQLKLGFVEEAKTDLLKA